MGSGQGSMFLLPLLLLALVACGNCGSWAVGKDADSSPHRLRSSFFRTQEAGRGGIASREKEQQEQESESERFFEVARPVDVPAGVEPCRVLLLRHSFAFTYGEPPAEADVQVPEECGTRWEKVVLKWRGTCKGRQFDRISAVWINGVEIFRTCTAEPVQQGIVWEVEKDITRFASQFHDSSRVVMSLSNVVDNTYTGIFNITLEAWFYPGAAGATSTNPPPSSISAPADVIIPVVHMPPELGDGGYFQRIENSSHVLAVPVSSIPRNTHRAVLEVCVSFHEQDEFWYTNAPDIWIKHANVSGYPGNGAFREVEVGLDGKAIAAVWPFPVIYTGGIDPYLWRPAAAIGAFNLPSYDFDITPFVGGMVDGSTHTFTFSVRNALNVWFVQGNLHLWLDPAVEQTSGKLLRHSAPAASENLDSHGYSTGLDGRFTTSASRRIAYSGYVESRHGKIVTSAEHRYGFLNDMVLADQADVQAVDQDTRWRSKLVVKGEEKEILQLQRELSFPLRLGYREEDLEGGAVAISVNLTHGFEREAEVTVPAFPGESAFDSLDNEQGASAVLVIYSDNTNSGAGESRERYAFQSSSGCFERRVVTRNYTVLSDSVDNRCIGVTAL